MTKATKKKPTNAKVPRIRTATEVHAPERAKVLTFEDIEKLWPPLPPRQCKANMFPTLAGHSRLNAQGVRSLVISDALASEAPASRKKKPMPTQRELTDQAETQTIGAFLGDVPVWPRSEASFLFSCRDKRVTELSNDEAATLGYTVMLLGELALRDGRRAVAKRLRAVVDALQMKTELGWLIPWRLIEQRTREAADGYIFVRKILRTAEKKGIPFRELENIISNPSGLNTMLLAEPTKGERI